MRYILTNIHRTKSQPAGVFYGAAQISSAACGYGFTLLSSKTSDVTKLWGMGLNKDSQLGFQRTQRSRRESLQTSMYCHYYMHWRGCRC